MIFDVLTASLQNNTEKKERDRSLESDRPIAKRKREEDCRTQLRLFRQQQERCTFWCYTWNSRPEEFSFSVLCRKRVPHHNFWFHKMELWVTSFQLTELTLKHLILSRHLTWFDLTLSAVSVFPVTFPSMFPDRIWAHSLLHTPFRVTNL